jgi:hypothetical protein
MTLTLLAPDLERPHLRLLNAMLMQAGLADYGVRVETWAQVREMADPTTIVASFGKTALTTWHDYGLILVGHQHGTMFRHRDTDHRHHNIMVLEHPGTLMQQSVDGYGSKAAMKEDLAALRMVLEGKLRPVDLKMSGCGKCQVTRVKGGGRRMLPATMWAEELDGVGLCDMHWTKRGQIKSKKVKKRVNPSSREAQLQGQMGMFPAPKG